MKARKKPGKLFSLMSLHNRKNNINTVEDFRNISCVLLNRIGSQVHSKPIVNVKIVAIILIKIKLFQLLGLKTVSEYIWSSIRCLT